MKWLKILAVMLVTFLVGCVTEVDEGAHARPADDHVKIVAKRFVNTRQIVEIYDEEHRVRCYVMGSTISCVRDVP